MQSLTAIPPDDIKAFLQANNIPLSPNFHQNYLATWDLLRSNSYQSAPTSIVDWIIASNLATSNIHLPSIKLIDILITPDINLTDLAIQLNLPIVDKARLIRILRYSNALLDDISFLETLPDDTILTIFSNLDCKYFPLICQLSSKLSNFCQRRLDDFLRQSLNKTTGLITQNYDRKQLVNLCQSSSNFNKNISAGATHSLVRTDKGQVYAFGNNNSGQLGLGTVTDSNIPKLIPNLINILQISAGGKHSLALSNAGQIYAFGDNELGQLGLGDYIFKIIPTLIENLVYIIQISAGYKYSLILSNSGQVYAFGSNFYGQLGLGDDTNKNIPTLIPNLPDIIQIASGCFHSLALSKSGQVYVFGDNRYDQLGLELRGPVIGPVIEPTLNPHLSDIIQIAAGCLYSIILSNTGQVYAFGNNSAGQLGLGNNVDRITPILIPDVTDIEQITAGGNHSLVLSNTGQIYAFGYNGHGQLGLGNNNNNKPTEVMSI